MNQRCFFPARRLFSKGLVFVTNLYRCDEYAVVLAAKALSDGVSKGCRGVVVFIHCNPKLAYEVEFLDDEDNTIEVLTATPSDIELYEQ